MTLPIPSGARVWLVTGHTDMRKGFNGLALQVQETLRRDPHSGHLFVFRRRAEALIAHLRLAIEKMRRELYGQRSERKARLLDQMELQLEELEAAAAEDELAAATATAAAGETPVRPHTRRTPSRKPFPAHLPRERIVVPGPTTCTCCGSGRLAKLGEDVTETLESVPRRWKVGTPPAWAAEFLLALSGAEGQAARDFGAGVQFQGSSAARFRMA